MSRLADSRIEAEFSPTIEGVWQFRNVVRYLVRLKRAVLWRFQHCAYRCERLDQLLEGAHNLSSNNSCRAFAHLASMALVKTPYEGTGPTIRNSRSVYCALTAIVKGEWPYPLPVELRRFTFAARRSSKRL